MTTMNIGVNRRLAQTVALTHRLRTRPRRVPLLQPALAAVDFAARGVFYLWRNRRYLSTLKLMNMALVNVQFMLKTGRVVGRPYKMKIESTNICNTKCQLCPTGIGLEGRPKGRMSVEQYRGLIDRFRWHLLALDLSMWGDPLIVPEIYDMIRYAHDRGIWTYISSNLHAFKPQKGQAEALVESGLDLMTCSLHGASQGTFEIYQPGKSFGDAVEKVRHIVQTRRRMNSDTPQVQLNFVVTRHNEHERAAFQKLADELGCRAVFSAPSLNIRFLDRDKKLQPLGLAPDLLKARTLAHLEQWLPMTSEFVLPPYRAVMESGGRSEQYNGRKVMDCSWPWRQSVVNWDGTVSTCCGSFQQDEDMGSVLDQPFSKIWNGPKYRMARRSFRRRISETDAKGNPCANCPGFML
jgi:MoaA/NifB/PqqE/SkfB family radical SAM enzyme